MEPAVKQVSLPELLHVPHPVHEHRQHRQVRAHREAVRLLGRFFIGVYCLERRHVHETTGGEMVQEHRRQGQLAEHAVAPPEPDVTEPRRRARGQGDANLRELRGAPRSSTATTGPRQSRGS